MSRLDDGIENDLYDELNQFEDGDQLNMLDELDDSPEAYDVPHTTWRPSQFDALKSVQANYEAGDKFSVMELPTGTGKSSIATALGRFAPVLVLVHTLSLLDQYAEKYNFSVVKGSQEYECVLDSKGDSWRSKHNRIPTAADCHFDKMSECPVYAECPYILARDPAFF